MRFMRVMVFFDLPTTTAEDKRAYTRFRKGLLQNGFVMVQYSVYSRTVKNIDDATRYEKIVSSIVPAKGAVRLMSVTERQYDSIKIIAGERLAQENLLDTKDVLVL